MANFKQYETSARTWATAHLVAAAIIAAVAGLIVGALVF